MIYYVMYENIAPKSIVVRGKMNQPMSYQKFNFETGRWEHSAWAFDKNEIDRFDNYREISEKKALELIGQKLV